MAEVPADATITFLPCSDLGASREFYEAVLGLQLVADQGTCLIFKASADGFVGVCTRANPDPGDGIIVTLVADDVDRWCNEIVHRGGVLASGPEHSDSYPIYHAFIADPDGNLVEIQRFDDPDWATAAI
ncbi:MAG: VOC family protein [Acidimicrobiia bacterium]